MKQTMLLIAGSALATSALFFATAPARSAPLTEVVRVVPTADLNLASQAGRSALDHRLVNAAREVCGTASDVDLAGKNEARGCRKSVLAAARAKSAALADSRSRGAPILVASVR